jgi:opacity protein-like surface antigen
MKRFLLAAVGLITAISFAPAIADARSCCYGYRVKYYRVHPHYKVVRPAPRPARWALGLRLTAMSTDQMIADEAVVLGGLGGHLRYRGYRWGVELAVDGVGAEFVGGKIQRVSVPIQGSALLYLIPEGVFNLYLVGGMRIVPTFISWNYPNVQDEQHFTEFGLHGGLGVDLNLGRRVALNADMRFFGVLRGDEDPAGAYYAEVDEGIVPSDSTGLQFSAGVSFRF